MYSPWLIIWIALLATCLDGQDLPITLHIGALFDNDHSSLNNGQHDLQAARIAIDEINHRREELFHGLYTLTLLANNSRCDPIYAVDAFFHAIFRRAQLVFLVGTSCSNETKAVIQVADYYNLILFSHSNSFISPTNQTYSSLVRLAVSDETYHHARVAFLQSNHWSHVAILHQDSIEYSLMMANLAKRLNESNINVILTQSASWVNLTSALNTLREKKARVVFVHFDTSSRARFFCQVYRTFARELRERYVWILTGNDYHRWNISMSNCSRAEVLEAARGHIVIDSAFESKISPINPLMTGQQLQEQLQGKDHLDRQTLQAYDAIWVIALLIRASIERKIPIEQFTYNDMIMRDQWLTLLEEIHFHGVSGPVSFRDRERHAETLLSQFRIQPKGHQIQIIAEYAHLTGFNRNCSSCQPLIWPGAIPVDTERSEIRRVVLSIAEIAVITIACLSGLVLASVFLTFNVIYRHERYIKLSSPKLNNVMVIGAMHIYIAILLFAFDQCFLQYDLLGHACMLRIFLFSGGFSLTFGSMFLKTLRVYRIFTSHDRPLLHSKLLQDHYLLLICAYLYGIDVLCAVLWQLLDPHYTVFTYGSIRRLDMDTIVSNELYFCNSTYRPKILPFIYFYKSLLLIVGGYLAAKTRHVHISALNDSKFIVWSIYTVVLTSLFTVIVMISIQSLHTYIVLSFIVIIMTSFIICLIFLPKALKLKNRHREEVLSKDLYMDQSRTRRLAVEISYFESYRYAQLQNRELKTELVRLNLSVTNLQQKLDSSSSNVTMGLLPFAVRLASTFLQKPDIMTPPGIHASNKVPLETIPSSKEAISTLVTNPEENEDDDETSTLTTTSSNNYLFEFEHNLSSSSSSELHLSLLLQSSDETSSLSLTALETDRALTTDDDSMSLTLEQSTSDEESVLYLRLSDELYIAEATLDSDLERLDRYSS